MRWSRLLITTALSLFVIFGLIDAINAQRGSVRFDRQRSHSSLSSSSARPWLDDTALLESEENFSRSNARRRIPTSQASVERPSTRTAVSGRTRSRPTKAQPIQARAQEVTSSEEEFEPRATTKEQFAPSLRSEVVYQNEFARRSDKGSSEERVDQRRKTRLRGGGGGTTSTSTVATVRGGRKLGGRGSSGSRFSNEVEEVVSSSSARSVENRTRGKVKVASKERAEDVASDENYPEEFKKLLKAKFKENKVKNGNRLESSTEKDFDKSSEKEIPRFKVKVLSTTTEGPTTTVKVITPRPVNGNARSVPSRSRPSSSEESSENSRSRSRASSSVIVSTPRSSNKRVTPRPRTVTTVSTTTTEESIVTEAAATTLRPTRAYSRRPSIVSQLTSTTTTSTTTRKPYSPTTRSSTTSKRTFSAPATAPSSQIKSSETEPKRDNSIVISSLRNPSVFRSSSAQRQSRKPISSSAELSNEVKPVVIPSRSKALSPPNTPKRSQSGTGSGRVPNRFESNLKKTPVYTPTIPNFRATPPTTTTTQLTGYDDTDWDWPSVTEPAGLLNRLPPPSASASYHQRPTSGPTRWPSYVVAPMPSSSTTAYHVPISASTHSFSSDGESYQQMQPSKNKNPNELERHRVFASTTSYARAIVDADDVVVGRHNDYDDDDGVVRSKRIRAKKMSTVSQRSRMQPSQRRRGARRFINRMRNNLDYYSASSSSASLSSSRTIF